LYAVLKVIIVEIQYKNEFIHYGNNLFSIGTIVDQRSVVIDHTALW